MAKSTGLTRDEDDSLRRLSYMDRNGGLSSWSRQRVTELRTRDRRNSVREPREGDATPGDASRSEHQYRAAKSLVGRLKRLLRR